MGRLHLCSRGIDPLFYEDRYLILEMQNLRNSNWLLAEITFKTPMLSQNKLLLLRKITKASTNSSRSISTQKTPQNTRFKLKSGCTLTITFSTPFSLKDFFPFRIFLFFPSFLLSDFLSLKLKQTKNSKIKEKV